jgi:O-acetylserine/cysteine efflux transporter
MPLSHILLALLVVFVWGGNFVVIKWGLAELPPFLFATLRFAFSALPFAFFVKRPDVPVVKLATFGLLLGVGQFGLMFYAMERDITPGLASLVVQMQVFFTIGLAVVLRGERPRALSLGSLGLAVLGMIVIGLHIDHAVVTVLGLGLVLCAALAWASANMVAKSLGRVDPLAFMVWSSLFAAPALFLVSLTLEGRARLVDGLTHAGALSVAAVAWQALGNTLFGYGAWNYLLARHPAATVTPFALLVPVFGMTASSVLIGEPMPLWKLGATALVLAGLAVNVAATRAPTPPPQ